MRREGADLKPVLTQPITHLTHLAHRLLGTSVIRYTPPSYNMLTCPRALVPQTLVRRELLAALEGEADRGVSRHVADGVTDLALVLLEEQQQQQTKGAKGAKGGARRGGRGAAAGPGVACGWPELLGALQGWLGAAGAGAVTREAALQVGREGRPPQVG